MARLFGGRMFRLSCEAQSAAKAALSDGLLVDFSAFEDCNDPACREDQHAAADRGELLVVRTGAQNRRARFC
jgi:hypothetical protein